MPAIWTPLNHSSATRTHCIEEMQDTHLGFILEIYTLKHLKLNTHTMRCLKSPNKLNMGDERNSDMFFLLKKIYLWRNAQTFNMCGQKKNAGNVLTCNSWVCHRHKKKILLWLYSDINVLNSFLRIRTWLLTPLPPQSMILQCPFLHQYTHNVYLSWFRFATDYNPWFLSSVASVKVRNTLAFITLHHSNYSMNTYRPHSYIHSVTHKNNY